MLDVIFTLFGFTCYQRLLNGLARQSCSYEHILYLMRVIPGTRHPH
jgi:hypothetical protein